MAKYFCRTCFNQGPKPRDIVCEREDCPGKQGFKRMQAREVLANEAYPGPLSEKRKADAELFGRSLPDNGD